MQTVAASQVAEAFVAFVTETFMTPEGLGRQDVDSALIALEDSGRLPRLREDRRAETDRLISDLLGCTPEDRRELFRKTDPTSLALVLDRVQAGTHSLIRAAEAGVRLPRQGMPPLPEFFREILLQRRR